MCRLLGIVACVDVYGVLSVVVLRVWFVCCLLCRVYGCDLYGLLRLCCGFLVLYVPCTVSCLLV